MVWVHKGPKSSVLFIVFKLKEVGSVPLIIFLFKEVPVIIEEFNWFWLVWFVEGFY